LYKSGINNTLKDDSGKNTYNIKSGYTGSTHIADTTNSSKLVFDKNLKLSSSDSTDSNTVSLYGKFSADESYEDIRLVFDMNSEIGDNAVEGNVVFIDNAENMKYTIGKKNYKLDLSELSSTVATWLNGKGYADTNEVFANEKTGGDIVNLVQIFEENTARCFIKA